MLAGGRDGAAHHRADFHLPPLGLRTGVINLLQRAAFKRFHVNMAQGQGQIQPPQSRAPEERFCFDDFYTLGYCYLCNIRAPGTGPALHRFFACREGQFPH